jgi:MerR family transcriptional regulator, mercuric resistance operon regulatory protein
VQGLIAMPKNTPSRAADLTIGRLSAASGCKVETIRFYERSKLLPAPPRTEGGHRVYDDDHLRRLTFIRRARELGFTLDEVRALLALADREGGSCAEVRDLTMRHLLDVRAKLADLRRLERALAATVAGCEGGDVPDCPVLDTLRRPATPRPVARAG